MPAIGIDFGTVYYRLGVWRNGGLEIIRNSIGNDATPACVAFTDSGVLFGEEAVNYEIQDVENIVFDIKKLIGQRLELRCQL